MIEGSLAPVDKECVISWSKVAAVSGVSLSKSTPSWPNELVLASAVVCELSKSVTGGEGDRFAAILSTKNNQQNNRTDIPCIYCVVSASAGSVIKLLGVILFLVPGGGL